MLAVFAYCCQGASADASEAVGERQQDLGGGGEDFRRSKGELGCECGEGAPRGLFRIGSALKGTGGQRKH